MVQKVETSQTKTPKLSELWNIAYVFAGFVFFFCFKHFNDFLSFSIYTFHGDHWKESHSSAISENIPEYDVGWRNLLPFGSSSWLIITQLEKIKFHKLLQIYLIQKLPAFPNKTNQAYFFLYGPLSDIWDTQHDCKICVGSYRTF